MEKFLNWDSNEEIKIFRDYLRIPTVHPNVNYDNCVNFLKQQALGLDLPVKVIELHPKKPIVIMTWVGENPSLKTIILNSHMDVVPVFEEKWTQPPFGANMDRNGKIYARGAQDMKSVGMQFLGAIRAMKKDGIRLKRTIHVTFVPDEETGGKLGMAEFVHTKEFRDLNCAFAIDEGIAGPGEEFPLYYAERSLWHMHFHITGTPGHGSLLHKNTAGEKARVLIDKFMDLRAINVKKLEDNPNLTIADVNTINLTKMNGGVQTNVVPPELTVSFDVRLAIDVKHLEFEQMVLDWCVEAGGGIEIEYELKNDYVPPTKLNESNPFWQPFKEALDEMNLKFKTLVFPGATDSRYIRSVGIPAIGFSPMNHTPVLLHDHDEFLQADIYLKGIEIYRKIIQNVANVQET